MKKANLLPPVWCVKNHPEVIKYMNENYEKNYMGRMDMYYGIDKAGNPVFAYEKATFNNVELTIEQFRACTFDFGEYQEQIQKVVDDGQRVVNSIKELAEQMTNKPKFEKCGYTGDKVVNTPRTETVLKYVVDFKPGDWCKVKNYNNMLSKHNTNYIGKPLQIQYIEEIYLSHGKMAKKVKFKNIFKEQPDSLYIEFLEPCTDKEIADALIQELKARGAKEQMQFDNVFAGQNCTWDNKRPRISYNEAKGSICFSGYEYNRKIDTLCLWGRGLYIVYKEGKFIELPKPHPEIKIGGYKVEFKPGKKTGPLDNPYTEIDGYFFDKPFWQAAQKIASNSKACVQVGCSHQFKVSAATIEQILGHLSTM